MNLSFAHLSDPHNPLPPNVSWRDLLNKRFLGFQSWHRKRHLRHRPEVLEAMLADIAAQKTDHILVSGDLVNIALPSEFAASRTWLEGVGPPRDVTVIPGNHDAYVGVSHENSLKHWEPWMLGDGADSVNFPFLRRRGPVAFVMVSTAVPTRPFSAAGELGQQQLDKLDTLLSDLQSSDSFRVVVLHHPPEDRPTVRRKALRDRVAFRNVLARRGAELVLHGHQHHSHFGHIAGPFGRIPVLGVPSASMIMNSPRGEAARWNICTVQRTPTHWQLNVEGRALTGTGFASIGQWYLNMPFSRTARLPTDPPPHVGAQAENGRAHVES